VRSDLFRTQRSEKKKVVLFWLLGIPRVDERTGFQTEEKTRAGRHDCGRGHILRARLEHWFETALAAWWLRDANTSFSNETKKAP